LKIFVNHLIEEMRLGFTYTGDRVLKANFRLMLLDRFADMIKINYQTIIEAIKENSFFSIPIVPLQDKVTNKKVRKKVFFSSKNKINIIEQYDLHYTRNLKRPLLPRKNKAQKIDETFKIPGYINGSSMSHYLIQKLILDDADINLVMLSVLKSQLSFFLKLSLIDSIASAAINQPDCQESTRNFYEEIKKIKNLLTELNKKVQGIHDGTKNDMADEVAMQLKEMIQPFHYRATTPHVKIN